MQTQDRLIQGMAGSGDFRVVAAQTTIAVDTAREILDLSPVAADALGRAMTGALLMAPLLAKDFRNQYVTLRFEGNGPLGAVIADGNLEGNVRGYVQNPVPQDPTLDVARALGRGRLIVVRGVPPTGTPYTSQMLLEGSGVAQDLTRYLLNSEQIASAVLLGVMNRRDGVAAAGGIAIQAFPHASETAIAKIEQAIKDAPPLSTLLEKMEIEDVVATVLQGTDYKQIDAACPQPVTYSCHCTRERAIGSLAFFGREDLLEMIDEGGTEIRCQFCGRRYEITADEILALTATHEA